jgi:hypothetical protein
LVLEHLQLLGVLVGLELPYFLVVLVGLELPYFLEFLLH